MKRRLLIAVTLTLLMLLGALRGQAQTPVPENITVEIAQVDNSAYPNVTLYIRVFDVDNQLVQNLTQDQFEVTEDGKKIDIIGFSSVNLSTITTLLLIDISSSMDEDGKIGGAKEAALTLVNMMRPQDQVGLVVFNTSVTILQDFTSDKEALEGAIRQISAEGSTAWYDAVITAASQIRTLSGRKSVILLSDGLDNSSLSSFNDAVYEAQASGAPVYSIGLGSSGNFDRTRLESIAEATGGEFYHAPSAGELEELYRKIAETTQAEYVITYRSPRPVYDGTRRNIIVTVGGATVSEKYTEEHLLHIQSDLLVGLVCLVPLLLGVMLPLGVTMLLNWQQSQPQVSAPAVPPVPSALPVQPPATQPARSVIPSPGMKMASAQCSHCGSPLRQGACFCAGCGQIVAPPVVLMPAQTQCANCGRTLRPDAKFCAECGKRV